MKRNSVLLVDDDLKLVQLLRAYFEKDNFIVYEANDGLAALREAREKQPDIMVLDLMLPGMAGWDVCKKIRQGSNLPILMLTARDEESDRLIGLEIGADDYVTKPFSPREVVARAKAILRRTQNTLVASRIVKTESLTINLDQHQVEKNGLPLEFTPTEFNILLLLVENANRVFSRLQIVEQTQGYSFEGYERTIDAHIKNIRRKLEENPRDPKYIVTVYGIGYKFIGDANEAIS